MIVKGWAKEYVKEGMQQGMLTDAKETVLEALGRKFSSNIPVDIHRAVNALNNRVLLKKLLRSSIQSAPGPTISDRPNHRMPILPSKWAF